MRTCDSWTLSSSCPSHLINWRVSHLRINSFIWRVNSIHTKQTPSQIDFLKRKGVYPCSYMDSFDKFAEEKLPPKELWKNTLAGVKSQLVIRIYNMLVLNIRLQNTRSLSRFIFTHRCFDFRLGIRRV